MPRSGPRPRLLDLFCCAGGAAEGYYRAGFDVVGVDIDPQPNYPFPYFQTDALKLPLWFLRGFDVIHASPPCQSYSVTAKRTGKGNAWPRLIDPVRDKLESAGKPWVIENVVGAPLRPDLMLCGTMFSDLRVIRHRLFESNIELPKAPKHPPHPLVHTLDRRKNHYGKTDEWKDYVQVTGGGNCSVEAAADAMGIGWPVTKRELNESIPPAYTKFIGRALREAA